jgi:hypothetical protein
VTRNPKITLLFFRALSHEEYIFLVRQTKNYQHFHADVELCLLFAGLICFDPKDRLVKLNELSYVAGNETFIYESRRSG